MFFLCAFRDYTVGTDSFRYAESFYNMREVGKSIEFMTPIIISISQFLFYSYTPPDAFSTYL